MKLRIAFIGAAGIPNRYGGFESFLEQCAPVFAQSGVPTTVTCDSRLYLENLDPDFQGVRREFINVPANGGASVLHDLVAFFRVLPCSSHIVVLGVSGGPWFPLFRIVCTVTGKKLVVNIDGVEWRRTKFSKFKRTILRVFDWLAQRFSHRVIYDNHGLRAFLIPSSLRKSCCISYPGDQIKRLHTEVQDIGSALTICRIEPENNLEMLIEGFLTSSLTKYTIVGNWKNSAYSQALHSRYSAEPRLKLLDPIYDANELAIIREKCHVYLHGHSVGGTNPSLVEMIFYDCRIFCFDVTFNRNTAGTCASYFSTAAQLSNLLDTEVLQADISQRLTLRDRYSTRKIADAYMNALASI